MATFGKQNHMYLSRIVLTPDKENAPDPTIERSREHEEEYYGNFAPAYARASVDETKITVPPGWTVTMETSMTERYKKLNAMLGHNLAMSALEALDGPVPDDDDLEEEDGDGPYYCCADCG